MKIYNIIIYAYLTILSWLLISCVILLSYGAETQDQTLTPYSHSIMQGILWFALCFVIVALIVAPKPQRS